MKKNRAVVSLLALSLLLAACNATVLPPVPASGATASSGSVGGTRTSEGGQVTVVATWTGRAVGATFDIKLDTHSVDLDRIDLSNAILRNDRGEILIARPWAAPKGGHHREGALAFSGDASGFLDSARWIELTLGGVGDIAARTFRWEVDA